MQLPITSVFYVMWQRFISLNVDFLAEGILCSAYQVWKKDSLDFETSWIASDVSHICNKWKKWCYLRSFKMNRVCPKQIDFYKGRILRATSGLNSNDNIANGQRRQEERLLEPSIWPSLACFACGGKEQLVYVLQIGFSCSHQMLPPFGCIASSEVCVYVCHRRWPLCQSTFW